MVSTVPDCRRPGQPMRHIGFKLPEEACAELDAIAGNLQVHRGTLARHLLLQALAAERADAG